MSQHLPRIIHWSSAMTDYPEVTEPTFDRRFRPDLSLVIIDHQDVGFDRKELQRKTDAVRRVKRN